MELPSRTKATSGRHEGLSDTLVVEIRHAWRNITCSLVGLMFRVMKMSSFSGHSLCQSVTESTVNKQTQASTLPLHCSGTHRPRALYPILQPPLTLCNNLVVRNCNQILSVIYSGGCCTGMYPVRLESVQAEIAFTLAMPKRIVAFKCACGCEKMIKTLDTQRRHLAGLGPMAIKANYTLQQSSSPRKSKGGIPSRGARGLPRHRRKPQPTISASSSMSSIRFPSNSSTHHLSPLDLPQVGDPGPSTHEHRARRSSSASRSSHRSQSPLANHTDASCNELGQDFEHPAVVESETPIPETPGSTRRRPAVELEEVPDADDLDQSSDSDAANSEYELGGIISDDSGFDSDADDDEGWINGVSAEEKLNDRFNAEAAKRGWLLFR